MPKKAMTQRPFFHYSLLMFLLIIGGAVAFLIYTAYTTENDAAVNISSSGAPRRLPLEGKAQSVIAWPRLSAEKFFCAQCIIFYRQIAE